MFTSKDYRAKAAEFEELAKTGDPAKSAEFRKRERSFTSLADNEEWLAHNFAKTLHSSEQGGEVADTLAATEEHVLRCLGAAVIMQWNTIPKKLQRELFDSAGSMGDMLNVAALRGQIARFLHKHKDDER
jgi:rubrerythrin